MRNLLILLMATSLLLVGCGSSEDFEFTTTDTNPTPTQQEVDFFTRAESARVEVTDSGNVTVVFQNVDPNIQLGKDLGEGTIDIESFLSRVNSAREPERHVLLSFTEGNKDTVVRFALDGAERLPSGELRLTGEGTPISGQSVADSFLAENLQIRISPIITLPEISTHFYIKIASLTADNFIVTSSDDDDDFYRSGALRLDTVLEVPNILVGYDTYEVEFRKSGFQSVTIDTRVGTSNGIVFHSGYAQCDNLVPNSSQNGTGTLTVKLENDDLFSTDANDQPVNVSYPIPNGPPGFCQAFSGDGGESHFRGIPAGVPLTVQGINEDHLTVGSQTTLTLSKGGSSKVTLTVD